MHTLLVLVPAALWGTACNHRRLQAFGLIHGPVDRMISYANPAVQGIRYSQQWSFLPPYRRRDDASAWGIQSTERRKLRPGNYNAPALWQAGLDSPSDDDGRTLQPSELDQVAHTTTA